MSQSSTMKIKITFFLIINVGIFVLGQSEATKMKPISDGPTSSPLPTHSEKEIPSPQYKHFLEECEKRITEECATEIFNEIFRNKTISENCCTKLVDDMGPDCHTIMIQRERDLLKDNKENDVIISKSEELWKRCSKITPVNKNRQYPKVPERQYLPGYNKFLNECEKKLTEKCGAQILDVVFDKNKVAANVDKDCCSKLFEMGHECRNEMHVRLEHLAIRKKETGSDVVKEKGHQILKYCEEINSS